VCQYPIASGHRKGQGARAGVCGRQAPDRPGGSGGVRVAVGGGMWFGAKGAREGVGSDSAPEAAALL